MPVAVQLLRNERVIVCTWTSPISPADLTAAFRIMGPVFKNATQPVYTIFDAIGITMLPSNTLSTFLHNENSPLRHPYSAALIGVTDNYFVRVMAETASKMRPGKLLLVNTVADALNHVDNLLSADDSIPQVDEVSR